MDEPNSNDFLKMINQEIAEIDKLTTQHHFLEDAMNASFAHSDETIGKLRVEITRLEGENAKLKDENATLLKRYDNLGREFDELDNEFLAYKDDNPPNPNRPPRQIGTKMKEYLDRNRDRKE